MGVQVEIPKLLQSFIPQDFERVVVYNKELQFLYRNLIEEFFKTSMKEKDESSFVLKSTEDTYTHLAIDISKWAESLELTNRHGIISDSFLRDLCFPGQRNPTKPREKKRLVIVFLYLEYFLTERKRKSGEYWCNELFKKDDVPKQIKNKISHNISFDGAWVIDDTFIEGVHYLTSDYSSSDFYLSKDDNNSQWVGIIKEWDQKRECYNLLMSAVLNSLNDPRSCLVAAVIGGQGGAGKSTVLRRLAFDILQSQDVIIIWVYSLKLFLCQITKLNAKNKYLIFLEDWGKIETGDAQSLLLYLAEFNNVKLIIGDRHLIARQYLEYCHDRNIFQLSNENTLILEKKVLIFQPEWKSIYNDLNSNSELNNSPLYLILFILARLQSKFDVEMLSKTDNIKNKFQSIVLSDQLEIFELYQGLAIALFWWANIITDEKMYITFNALLSVAEHCNQEKRVIEKSVLSDKSSRLFKLLSYYISVQPLTYPLLPMEEVFQFHHDLLANAWSQSFDKRFQPYKRLKVDFFEILINTNHINSALSFYTSFFEFKEYDQFTLYDIAYKFQTYSSLSILFDYSKYLKEIYLNASSISDDIYWKMTLANLLQRKVLWPSDDYSLTKILKKLVNDGCKSEIISATIEKASDNLYLEKILKYLLLKFVVDNPEDEYHKWIFQTLTFTRQWTFGDA